MVLVFALLVLSGGCSKKATTPQNTQAAAEEESEELIFCEEIASYLEGVRVVTVDAKGQSSRSLNELVKSDFPGWKGHYVAIYRPFWDKPFRLERHRFDPVIIPIHSTKLLANCRVADDALVVLCDAIDSTVTGEVIVVGEIALPEELKDIDATYLGGHIEDHHEGNIRFWHLEPTGTATGKIFDEIVAAHVAAGWNARDTTADGFSVYQIHQFPQRYFGRELGKIVRWATFHQRQNDGMHLMVLENSDGIVFERWETND